MFWRWLFRITPNHCLPWHHDWWLANGNITTLAFDMFSKGELWRCHNCPAIKAK